MRYTLTVLCMTFCCGIISAATPAGVRSFFVPQNDPKTCIAVGDNAMALKSTDAGKTWQPLKLPAIDANLHCVSSARDGAETFLMGGGGVMGYPLGGIGRGVILQSQPGRKSFKVKPAGITGWIYTGVFATARGAVGGQAASDALSGLFNTFSAGRVWLPLAVSSRGYILGGTFDTWKSGYMVGSQRRIIDLKNLIEPKVNVPSIPSPWPLRAAALAPDKTCWTVGDNGTILTSDKPGAPWPVRPISLPANTRLICDFECIDITGQKIAIGGGLDGVIFLSTDEGATFTPLPIPANTPVRCLKWLDENTLLAGTDGGAIWRSEDSGKTWEKVAGENETDLLIIASAMERGIYPVIRAHADCGVRVSVLFAAVPNHGDSIPPEQQLRAAALKAGAQSVAFLGDFESLAGEDFFGSIDEKTLSEKWGKLLDVDPREQMTLQIAAAIRLYKPKATAVGFVASGYRGKFAEITFVSRCALDGVEMAAKDDAMKNFVSLNLPPHKIARVFSACESNEQTSVPWDSAPPNASLKKCTFSLLTSRVISGQSAALSYQAAQSIWLTGGGFLDRPCQIIAYNSPDLKNRRVLLMTQGLSPQRLRIDKLPTSDALLANGGMISFADAEGRLPVIMNELIGVFTDKTESKTAFNRKLAAEDNLAFILYRLAAEGKLIPATQAQQIFLEYGKSHPMYEMLRVSSIATLSSSEFRAQMALVQLDEVPQINIPFMTRELPVMANLSPWATQPQGLALMAGLYRKINQPGQADHIIKRMLDADYSKYWDAFVRSERAIRAGKEPRGIGKRKLFKPEQIKGKMEIDGLLDDEVWKTATPLILTETQDTPGELVGYAMLARNKKELVVALRLPNAAARMWNVTIAIDSDRDTWVQEVIRFNSLGETSTQTVPFAGPVWTIDKRSVLLKKYVESNSDTQTFEIVLPMKHFDAEIAGRDYWGFQIIAVADGPGGKKAIYLQPQETPQLLPQRYGLLEVK